MIAHPNSTASDAAVADADANPLSAHELHRLTLYKWRYSLEAYGFDASEVRGLMFLKWLHATGRVHP